ncbi:PucR family transcriptional regulator [Streptantibioticus ferralitis]|uniref:Helix-turn-helix domain-containing protein n=1 Tax=Streptantibioticus ferralitis TaxID=236510 RepID=A0ABT5Z3Q0_9ACTN|nr:helix-turn-helix domain-containing protein [Streptantibioticus ferralitis]MDF2258457.1 helix-turn-helix domain-containing protein [Streptantibioticus ferralitis]
MDTIPLKPSLPEPSSRLGRMASLCELATMMFDARDEKGVLKLAAAWIASLGSSLTAVGYLKRDGLLVRTGARKPATDDRTVDSKVRALSGEDAALDVPGFGRALALRHRGTCHGYLVLSAPVPLSADDQYMATVLARQTAAALEHVRARRNQRERAGQLRRLNRSVTEVNASLRTVVAELQRRMAIHEALNRVAFSGQGEQGILRVLHELTGFPTLAEDRFGRLRAWAGPKGSAPPHGLDPARRAAVLRRAEHERGPVREQDLLVSVARPHGELLGLLMVADPHRRAGETETFALDQAGTALALELSRERHLADAELRMGSELVEDLVTGTDEKRAFARSESLGHDLHGPHRVVVVKWTGPWSEGTVTEAVGRAASVGRLDYLLGSCAGATVLVVGGPVVGDTFYDGVSRELGAADGAIGVGGRCETPGEYPHSYQEALRALEIRQNSTRPHGLSEFDRLGLYRVLRTGDHDAHTERFVREWLGPLIDYDTAHHGELVPTLTAYLENSSYDATAASLAIHRSTLRYRLRRIREISGLDITDVEARLNLHVASRIWNMLTNAP